MRHHLDAAVSATEAAGLAEIDQAAAAERWNPPQSTHSTHMFEPIFPGVRWAELTAGWLGCHQSEQLPATRLAAGHV